MKARTSNRRRLGWFVILAAGLAGAVAACETAPTRDAPECKPGAICTCEEDPTQPLCRGFNDRPDATVPVDAADVQVPDTGGDTSIPDTDGGIDASDDADSAI